MQIQHTPTILVSESVGFTPAARHVMEELGRVLWRDLDHDALLNEVREADVLWVRLKNYIDADIMDAAPRLKVIVTPTTAMTHIDTNAASERGIAIISLRDADPGFLDSVRATAEHTMALVLALLRGLPAATEHVRAGLWDRDCFRGRELFGKTVGIVGFGRLGRIVARYFQAFGCTVLATDPNIDANSVDPHVRLTSLQRLLKESDLVTIHVNMSNESYRFFGEREFRSMRSGSWFINTSRGELVDEEALLDALHSGHICGAALDVVSDEQKNGVRNSPLLAYAATHGNLIITPHIGGCTYESMDKTERHMIEKLKAALARACVGMAVCL